MRFFGLGWRVVVAAWLAGCAQVSGQTPVKPYTDESMVIERSELVYQYAADGTGMRLNTVAVRVQSEAALRELGVLTIPYAANSEKVEFPYVRVRHPDGTVSETPVADAMEMPTAVTREAPFYSDLKEKQLPLKSLRVGDTVEWQAKVTRTKAEAPGQFWGSENFLSGLVVLSQKIELRVPKDSYVNVWSPGSKPADAVEGTEHVYRWQHSELKPTVGAEAEAEKEAKKKKILTAAEELDQKEGRLPDIAWSTFKSWEAVGAWYRGLEGERMVADADLKAKVAEITAGKTTQLEKVQAVYSFVATQVRYIGVAFGVGRYQPHGAANVLENQYGDCKDKHTLLAAMLGALGLHPDAALIGAGIRFNEAVPSPGAFNHLITRVDLDGAPVWLDTTSEVAPYRVLLYQLRDHTALVVPETGAASIVKTPAELPFKAFQTLDANGSLDSKGLSTSRMVLTLRGDDEVILRTVARQVPPAQYDAFVQKVSENLGFGGTVSHAEISRPEDTSEPLKISYDYKREKVGDWDNLRTIAQVAPVALPRYDKKDPPVQTIPLGLVRTETSTSAMKLPEGWVAEVPEAVHLKSAYATVDQTYRFNKGVLYSERKVQVLREKVPVAELQTYMKWTEDSDLGSEQYVQLIRGKNEKAEVHDLVEKTVVEKSTVEKRSSEKSDAGKPVPAGTSNAELQKLMAKAITAIQQMDLATAGTLLDQAKAANPQLPYLWSAYAYLALQRGEVNAAIADCEKELAAHPAEVQVYATLAAAQLMQNNKTDAMASYKKWAALDPANALPLKELASLQFQFGSAADAAATAEKALALTDPASPERDERLQLLAGQAEMKAGMKEKGQQTLVTLLQSTSDAGMMNDAAYELANAGLELPLAETKTRTALEKMEDESRSWTLDENLQTLRNKSNLIAATWDTLGWILFREQKLDDAEGFVKAAWLNRQSIEVGEHLGDIAMARGDKAAALKAYELALAMSPNHQVAAMREKAKVKNVPKGAQPPEAPQEKTLEAKAGELEKAGVQTTVWDAAAALQKLRVIALGAANGLDGTAEYRILLNAQKVERVEPTGDKQLKGGADRLMKMSLPAWMPGGSTTQLVKVGLLNCHSEACEVVFEP